MMNGIVMLECFIIGKTDRLRTHLNDIIFRLKDAILCPTTNPDHNPALMGSIRSEHDSLDFEYATEEQMDEFYEQNYV